MQGGVVKKVTRPKHNEQTSSSQSRMLHVKSQQNLHDKISIDQFKLQQQFLKQIQLAKQAVQKYSTALQQKLLPKTPPLKNSQCIKLMQQMQRLMQSRNIEINILNQQIKILRTTPQQINQDINKKYKTVKNVQLYKLTDQLIQQKEQLLTIQRQHQRKKKELQSNKRIMEQTLQAFTNGQNTGSRYLMSYSQFLARKKQKKNQDTNQKSRRLTRRNITNIKQALDNQQQKQHLLSSDNLKYVQNKKIVAEGALKGTKKNHQVFMNQLNLKLQFLRDQNLQLDIKLNQKMEQLKSAQLRFSQTKQQQNPQNTQNTQNSQNTQQNVQTNKKLTKLGRYSQPQLQR